MVEQKLPLMTIGLTCFNAENTILRAAASAMSQTWRTREILVLDDCSSDGSWALLQDLAREHPGIRLMRHDKNSGYPAALNTLLSHARGEFVAFFDDDDESTPERLVEQYGRITAYESLVGNKLTLCYSNRRVVLAGKHAHTHIARAIGHRSPEPHGSVVADYILGVPSPNHFCWGDGVLGSCTLMARRSVFAAIGSFDVSFRRAAEMDFAIRAALAGAHFISIDAPLVTQYKTASDDKSLETNFSYWFRLCTKYKNYLRARSAYWGSLALLRMNFHEAQGNTLRAWHWRIAAVCSLPWRLSIGRLWRRATSQQRATNGKTITHRS